MSDIKLFYQGESFDPNFYYYSGLSIDHSFFVDQGDKKFLLVSHMNEAIARASLAKGRLYSKAAMVGLKSGIKIITYLDPFDALTKLLKGKAVSFDATSTNAKMAARLSKICKLEDHSEEFLRTRAIKKPHEVAWIKKAVKATRKVFDSIDLKAAKTEQDVQKQLLKTTIDMGLEKAFDPIISTDHNTAYPHSVPTAKRLGSLVMVDYGVRYGHYCADMTRCFILDNDRKKKGSYDKLQQICYSIVDSINEGGLETGKDIATLAIKLISNAGFPKMPHSIGHGVGLEIHEFPRLSIRFADKLKGSVLAIEPAFYIPGSYGMRYEETVDFSGKKACIL